MIDDRKLAEWERSVLRSAVGLAQAAGGDASETADLAMRITREVTSAAQIISKRRGASDNPA